MKIEKQFRIGVKDVGKDNELTNYAFLSFLEEIACMHSDICGYGIADIPTKCKAWILMEWKLKVIKRPKYADILNIKTWARVTTNNSFFTYRDFEVYNNNELIAIASSKWVLIDTNLKKITKITPDINELYQPENLSVFNEKEIQKIKEPIEKELKLRYTVKRSDIDVIKHMHNLNYLNLAYECLPEESYNNYEKNNVRIMYKHQILLGETVNCYYLEENEKETITIKSNDDSVLHAIVELS